MKQISQSHFYRNIDQKDIFYATIPSILYILWLKLANICFYLKVNNFCIELFCKDIFYSNLNLAEIHSETHSCIYFLMASIFPWVCFWVILSEKLSFKVSLENFKSFLFLFPFVSLCRRRWSFCSIKQRIVGTIIIVNWLCRMIPFNCTF